MKYWHINCATEGNKNHMIRRNYCYIGLGNDIDDFNQRILKNKNTTPYQFYKFRDEACSGDMILLYQNKKGYIAYGNFTGIINEPIIGCDMAPDWRKTEIQKHIQVDDWKIINNPSTKYFKRKTLVEIEENSINKIINF